MRGSLLAWPCGSAQPIPHVAKGPFGQTAVRWLLFGPEGMILLPFRILRLDPTSPESVKGLSIVRQGLRCDIRPGSGVFLFLVSFRSLRVMESGFLDLVTLRVFINSALLGSLESWIAT